MIFVTLTVDSFVVTNARDGLVGTHFHVRHGTKTTPVLLPVDGEASWSLRPSFSLDDFVI